MDDDDSIGSESPNGSCLYSDEHFRCQMFVQKVAARLHTSRTREVSRVDRAMRRVQFRDRRDTTGAHYYVLQLFCWTIMVPTLATSVFLCAFRLS